MLGIDWEVRKMSFSGILPLRQHQFAYGGMNSPSFTAGFYEAWWKLALPLTVFSCQFINEILCAPIQPHNVNFLLLCQGSTKEIALHLLEACNGDLEMAVGMHIDGTANGETASGEISQDSSSMDMPASDWWVYGSC